MGGAQDQGFETAMDKRSKTPTSALRGSEKMKRPTDASKGDWIGKQLRRVYDEALSEPLPEDLMSLLRRIDKTPSGTPGAE